MPLGKTGLEVSILGIGCGGYSRLGLSQGKDEANAIKIISTGLKAGINLIDTAEAYRTEEVVGRAIKTFNRLELILSTKVGYGDKDTLRTPAQVEAALHASLQNLGTDYLDLCHFHGVSARDYPSVKETLYPVLARAREQGKVRFIGITEAFASDTDHRALGLAVEDDLWDVIMVGFNILNPSARRLILKKTREKGIGTLCMFAVRQGLNSEANLKRSLSGLIAEQKVDKNLVDLDRVFASLIGGAAGSLPEAAYRFCRHEPGLDCILSGTGSAEHLEENIRNIKKPVLPDEVLKRLYKVFGNIDSISGN